MAIRPIQFSDSSPIFSDMSSPEDRVDQLERGAEDLLRLIPKEKHQDYRVMVRRALGHIRTQITTLRALGKCDYEINKALPELFGIFYAAQSRYIEENKKYSENKSLVWNEHRETARRIDQCIQDFDRFEPEFSLDDDEPDYLKDHVQEHHPSEHSAAGGQLHKVADTMAVLHVSGKHLPKKVAMLGKAALALGDILENPTGPVTETLVCETGVHLLEETANITIAGGSAAAIGAGLPLTLTVAVPASVLTAIGLYKGIQKVSAPAAKELKKVCHRSFEQLREMASQTSTPPSQGS